MNKILILGGSGFIGNKLYRELNKFYKTFSTYNNNTKNKENSHFYYFRMEELNINILLNKIKPNIIISCLRGDFELQVLTHREICNYVKSSNCKIVFLSSSNVFDTFRHYPSYENDKTFSESPYGIFKIKIENLLLKLPTKKFIIARLPMIWGNNSPRIKEIKRNLINKIPIEVYPNTIINLNSINKLCQQILYLINQNKNGIYHLGTYDLIYHDDLINKIIKRKFKNKAIFKFVYSSNTERYIATLPKENKLPKHLNISCNQVINSLSIKRSF
tara:strand:+ start:258 stop:1079 length:822 start_codon:yes stop_codon:yes gene_type:complete